MFTNKSHATVGDVMNYNNVRLRNSLFHSINWGSSIMILPNGVRVLNEKVKGKCVCGGGGGGVVRF